jgi:hypothetical protein
MNAAASTAAARKCRYSRRARRGVVECFSRREAGVAAHLLNPIYWSIADNTVASTTVLVIREA